MGKLSYKREKFINRKPSERAVNKFTRSGLSDTGIKWRSRKNSPNQYSIHIRFGDFTFNWLNWNNPYQEVWFVMVNYPTNFMDWVHSVSGVDLETCSFNEWVNFAEATGLVSVRGNPPPAAISEARQFLKIPLELLRNNKNKI